MAKLIVSKTASRLIQPVVSYHDQKTIFEEFSSSTKSLLLNDEEIVELLDFAKKNGYASIIREHRYQFEIQAEKIFAKQNLSDPKTTYVVHDNDALRDLVASEVAIIPAGLRKTILFVGGGAFPYSAVIAQHLTESHITIVDKDQEAIELARLFVDGLGLEDKFSFILADIHELNVSKFDVVWLAAMVHPKEQVITSLSKRMKLGARILIRQIHGLEQLLYGEAMGFRGKSIFEVEMAVTNKVPSTCATTLLRILSSSP